MNEKAGMFSYKDVKIKDKKDNELNSWNIWFPIFGVGTKTRFLGPFKVNVRALIYVLNDSSFFFLSREYWGTNIPTVTVQTAALGSLRFCDVLSGLPLVPWWFDGKYNYKSHSLQLFSVQNKSAIESILCCQNSKGLRWI